MIQQFQMEETNKQKVLDKKQGWNLVTSALIKNCTFFPNLIVRVLMIEKLRKWKKFAGNSKQRYYKIKQWYQTEATYLKKLLVLRDQVRKPLLDNKLITQRDSAELFSNLDGMIQLSQLINLELKKIFTNWNPIKSQLSPVLSPLINCLKIYKDYSKGYSASFAFMQEVIEKPSYKIYVKVTNLDDLLFSPVQRFMKHHLFLSEYISKLPKYHKEIENLNKAKDQLLNATEQINQFIENQQKTQTLIELQNKFGGIASPSRRFEEKYEVKCWEANELICKAYLFNNLLLVVKEINQNNEYLIQRITLSGQSFIVKQPDCKYFQNRLYICGLESSVHLSFGQAQKFNTFFEKITKNISQMHENSSKRQNLIFQNKRRGSTPTTLYIQYLINVYHNYYHHLDLSAQVICTEKLFFGQEQKNLYVIKISSVKPYQISQYLFYDLRKLQQLQQVILQIFPNLKVPSHYLKEKRNKNDMDISSAIQKFCNFILRDSILSKHHNFVQILSKIGLHKIMQMFARSNRIGPTCLCSECSKVRQYTSFYYYYQHRHRFPKNCVVSSFQTINKIASSVNKHQLKIFKVQEIMVWAKCKLKRIDYTLVEEDLIKNYIREDQRQRIQLQVQVRQATEVRIVKTRKTILYSTSRQIIQQLVQILQLNSRSDFALMFVYGYYSTILDDDQYIYEYAKFLTAESRQENKRFSFRDTFLQKMRISKPKETKIRGFLTLRKLYIFNNVLEQASCFNNHTRIRLIAGQIFHRFIERNFIFYNQQQAVTFCSLFFYTAIQTNYPRNSELEIEIKIDSSRIKKLLPPINWNRINNQFITKIENQVTQLIRNPEISSQVYQKILREFGNCTLHITEYFQIEDNEKISQFGFENMRKYLIGVNHRKILITQQNYMKPLYTCFIQWFEHRIYGDTIYIENEKKTLQFKCKNIFVLDMMIKTYKAFKKLLND